MTKTAKIIISILFIFLYSETAIAGVRLVPVPGLTNYYLVDAGFDNYTDAYQACSDIMNKTTYTVLQGCGPIFNYDFSGATGSYTTGWFWDKKNQNIYYLLNIYYCGIKSGTIYFDDVNHCVPFQPALSAPIPSDPKATGISCPANSQARQPSCGNPINPGNGTKTQHEVDDAGAFGLTLSRTYNGGIFSDQSTSGSFGAWWTQPYDRHLTFQDTRTSIRCIVRSDNGASFCANRPIDGAAAAVAATRPDGKIYSFTKSGSGWLADADVDDKLVAQYAADGVTVTSWQYTAFLDNTVEQYDVSGKLLSVTSRSGIQQLFTYSTGASNDAASGRYPQDAPTCSNVQSGDVLPAGLLLCVTNNWGRQFQFEYDGQRRISKAINAENAAFLYEYDGPSGGCSIAGDGNNLACYSNNLTKVTYPDNTTRTYYYNEAMQINGGATCAGAPPVSTGFGNLRHALTGLVDENGARFATWSYDCDGRAIASEHAGGVEKVAILYNDRNSDGSQVATVTSSLGTVANPQSIVRNYHSQIILGVAKNDAVDVACDGCTAARTYDDNANVSTSTDWSGNKTSYSYDVSRNVETSRIQAVGTVQARTVSTQWHASYRLPLKIAEPMLSTVFSYDSGGNLLTKTIQATTDVNGSLAFNAPLVGAPRTWTYTYNAVGQVLTATGPRTDISDVTRYAYDAMGNLITVTNAAGQVTTLSNYDANGRVGRIAAPNGVTTDLTYTPRGWLSGRVVTSGSVVETTTYAYDGVGQLVKVTLPDTSSIDYTYDDAHRLTAINDSLGNSIHYTLDLVGNRVGEQVADSGGALAQQVSRVYDQLNRLQQQTGIVQ